MITQFKKNKIFAFFKKICLLMYVKIAITLLKRNMLFIKFNYFKQG